MYSREAIQAAQRIVREAMPPTPQQRWPLLDARLGAKVWVKHENHTPVGAFKVRGGLVYFDALRRREPGCRGVISATRGNHGQSIAFAARRHGLSARIVVPHGNSREKNAAMRAHGAELIACIAARAHTEAATRIVGVVSAHATAYLDSYRAGRCIEAPVSTLLADRMACRVPDEEPLDMIRREADDIVAVSDDEVAAAMRALFSDTHNAAIGAGAASLAAAMQQRERWRGKTIGVTLCGGNVDRSLFTRVLADEDGKGWR